MKKHLNRVLNIYFKSSSVLNKNQFYKSFTMNNSCICSSRKFPTEKGKKLKFIKYVKRKWKMRKKNKTK